MRIFQILEASANAAVGGNRTWYRNLYEPLVEMGHEIVLFSAGTGRQAMQRQDRKARDDLSQRLLETFRREHAQTPFDLIFAYLMDGMVDPCTGYLEELAEHFEPDREVGVYHSQYELLDKARFYLSHPEDAERIRQAGHARALRDHTYQRRFQQLFEALHLPGGQATS